MIDPAALDRFEALVTRRLRFEPVAYLLGRREFYGRSFRVDARVLTPRPETEHLVEAALERIPRPAAGYRILDVGTGSGILAATLAQERPDAVVFACDRSREALELAAANRAPRLHQADLVAAVADGSLDMVVANLPYLDPAAQDRDPPDLRHEPEMALYAGEQGLALNRRLLTEGLRVLRPGGWLLAEHGSLQGDELADRARALGYPEVFTGKDLAQRPRFLAARRGGA